MALLSQVNTSVDNIGARRLHTVLERIVEEISFDAPEKVGNCAVPLLHDIMCKLGSLLASVEFICTHQLASFCLIHLLMLLASPKIPGHAQMAAAAICICESYTRICFVRLHCSL